MSSGSSSPTVAASRAGHPTRILGAVDETHQVPLVDALESVYLVDNGGRAAQPLYQLPGQIEAEIHPADADMKQQVAGRGHGNMPTAGDLQNGCGSAGRDPTKTLPTRPT